jgi:hypothetical protein
MPHRTLQTRLQDEYNIPGHILNFSTSPLEQEPAVDPIRHSPVLLKEALELLRPQPEASTSMQPSAWEVMRRPFWDIWKP